MVTAILRRETTAPLGSTTGGYVPQSIPADQQPVAGTRFTCSVTSVTARAMRRQWKSPGIPSTPCL